MSTPTTNIREIFARIEHGLAGCREAKVLKAYIEHLVYGPVRVSGEIVEVCRHCGCLRGTSHQVECPAQALG